MDNALTPYSRPQVKILRLDSRAVIPTYAKPGDAGADLATLDEFYIHPGERKLVRTGIALQLPPGWYARIRGRSGLGVKQGIEVGIGTVDEGYTGEIKVLLYNHSHDQSYRGAAGDRIAQMLIVPYWQAAFEEVEELHETARGASGFGSSGA